MSARRAGSRRSLGPAAGKTAADVVAGLLLGRVYSIGILSGPSPLELSADGIENPVLTRHLVPGPLATFVADPFLVPARGRFYMFFEVMRWTRFFKKGEIAFASSPDGRRWTYERTVLTEPFHLSYPYVFEWAGEHWMIPESTAAGAVRLYRADPFPTRWTYVRDLLTGPRLLDSSIFRWADRWWLLTTTDDRRGTLRLFHAAELTGPWAEHPRSPVVAADPRIARCAGRVLTLPDRVIRFAQDCRDAYGSSVAALEIVRLSPDDYAEVELSPSPLLAGSGRGWNRKGMHQIDVHPLADGSWLACVDGWTNQPRRPREVARWLADRIRGNGTISRGERR